MPIIYVVRHGETDMNLNEKINDKNMTATINKTGIKQAKKLVCILKTENFRNQIVLYTHHRQKGRWIRQK